MPWSQHKLITLIRLTLVSFYPAKIYLFGENNGDTRTMEKTFVTNSIFHVKLRTTGNVQFLFLYSFLVVLQNFHFGGGVGH